MVVNIDDITKGADVKCDFYFHDILFLPAFKNIAKKITSKLKGD